MKSKPMATRIKKEPSPEFIFGMSSNIDNTVGADPVIYESFGKKEIVDHDAWISDLDEFNKMIKGEK